MLQNFLEKNKIEVLALTAKKSAILAGSKADSAKLQLGLPLFFDQLILVLGQKLISTPPKDLLQAAAEHGKEFLRLGYTLSHVVHSYGAMCQAITELAVTKDAKISAHEFNLLNGCLDVAIASAVSEFQFRSNEASEEREIRHLGFLAHELRNALSSTTIAHEMIKAGLVGLGGSTASLLESNLARMRHLIDRALSEVRMRADSDLLIEPFRLADLFDQIIITAKIDATKKNQTLEVEVGSDIQVEGDRQFLLSALGNLIQNAIKYTKIDGKILLKGHTQGDRLIIEVEDECGGILDKSKIQSLFEPFTQENVDRSGLGLGLAITQRAVHLSKGKLNVENKPGHGCVFEIDIPL